MFARASLAVLFAVLLAMSRPVPSGGNHDLVAFGVRYATLEGGTAVERTALTVPTEEALRAYDRLLRSSARQALLQGTTVYATVPPAEGETGGGGPRILEGIYYGRDSRAGRARVTFREGPDDALPGTAEALEAARTAAGQPPAVTAAAARVLLAGTADGAAWRDGLFALLETDPTQASAVALEAVRPGAEGPGDPTVRRVHAVTVLRHLGGSAVYPELFARLAKDDDPLVKEAAAR